MSKSEHPVFRAIAAARTAMYAIELDGMDLPAMSWTVETKNVWTRLVFQLIKESGLPQEGVYNYPSHTFTIMGIKFTLTSKERFKSEQEYVRLFYAQPVHMIDFSGAVPQETAIDTLLVRNADWFDPRPGYSMGLSEPLPRRVFHADKALDE